MKKILTIAPWIAIIILLIYIGSFTHRGKCKPEIITKDSILEVHTVDSFPVQGKTVYYPSPYEVVKPVIQYKDVDSAKIIQNYLTENKYKFNISDSTGNIDVFLSVQYNQLKSYDWKGYFKTYTRTITDTKYIQSVKRNKLIVGLILSGNKDNFGAVPTVGLKTKKDNVFMAGYDVINKSYQAGYLLGIGRK
jgi:hypothetical protein